MPKPGTYVVPRGWAARVPAGMRVVTDEHEARTRSRALAAELRIDARAAQLAVLDLLAARIDRRHGLVIAVSLAELVEHTGASLATVRRAVARAVAGGVLARVGDPYSAVVLRSDQGVTPVYAFTAPAPEPPGQVDSGTSERPPAPTGPVFSPKSRERARVRAPREGSTPWGPQDRARTRGERRAAALALLERLGLTDRLDVERASAALRPWFAAGWCVRALHHAIDHAPDGTRIGDAARGVRDLLAVILARLRAWSGRLWTLPADQYGATDRRDRLRRAHHRQRTEAPPPAAASPAMPDRAPSAARLAAMASIRTALTRRSS